MTSKILMLGGLLCVASTSCASAAPPSAASALEINKGAARSLFEGALNRDDWARYKALHTSDFVVHSGRETEGLEEDLLAAKEWRKAFPDGKYSVERVVAEGDLVVVQYIGRGTNTGSNDWLPATGKSAEITGVTVFRLSGGKIAEEWVEYDVLSLLKQLGLAPSTK